MRRWPDISDRVLAAMLLLFAFLLASFEVRNPDLWMRLATGRLLVEGHYQFGVDPFAFTTRDVYWANQAWLFDGLVYGIRELAGDVGLVLAKALLLAGLAFIMLQVRRAGQGLLIPIVVTALAVVVMSPRFLLQPVLLSYFFLGVTIFLLLRSTAGASRGLWLLPPLFLVWANFDSWFFLGPLTVLFFFLGSLVESRTRPGTGPSPRLVGLVFLAGLACCLANPYLFRVFTLPAEAAYLVVQATDWLEQTVGIAVPMPDWMVAGGRTWQTLRDNDPSFTLWNSPLSEEYRRPLSLSNNLAALAYFPFLALGAVSFLPFLGGRWRDLPWTRLILWLPFALLGLLQARLVGIFAVVTGPVLVLNWQDFLQAPREKAGAEKPWVVAMGKRPVLSRLAVAVLLAGLLFLTWPGWLHGKVGDPTSAWRVAWTVEVDPSLKEAAEKLGRLRKDGRIRNGLASSVDLANYCAWFAPGVKGFLDNRYELFAAVAESYLRGRPLWQEAAEYFTGRAPPPEFYFVNWRQLAEHYDLDFLALTKFNRTPGNKLLAQRFWLEPERWPYLYGDGRTMVFGWNPGKPDRFAGETVDWNAAAFGRVPEEQRCPADGQLAPPMENFWTWYSQGQSSPPLDVNEAELDQLYFQFFAQTWARPSIHAWQICSLSAAAGLGAAVPWSVSAPAAWMSFDEPILKGAYLARLRAVDAGPPAAPLLMVRAARRAVARAPDSPEGYFSLAQACRNLWENQENYWASDGGQSQPNLRVTLRQVQVLAALKASLKLQPDNSIVHELLANMYAELHYVDVYLEHLSLALEHFEQRRPAKLDADRARQFRQSRDELQQRVNYFKADVKKRRDHFDLHFASKSALEKYHFALYGPFKTLDQNNKLEHDRRGLGLARTALAALQQTRPSQLSVGEKFVLVKSQLELLLNFGELKEVAEALADPNLQKLLDLLALHYQTLRAAAAGDYAQARAALTEQIEKIDLGRQLPVMRDALILNLAPGLHIGASAIQVQWYALYQRDLARLLSAAANLYLIRGLMALEEGDTAPAAQDFKACLDLVNFPIFFPDRPIAHRYRQLLADQQRRKVTR